MFKEILQIIPKLSPGDLNNMERSLTTRFGRIAKKFGKGLVASLTGGGLAGLALGLVDKLLNPLKETQDAIDRVLKQGDDLVTNAKQFGTTAGRLFRLQQLAASTGLDENSLDVLLTKFQTAVAEAVQDPTKVTSVRQFAGSKDIAEAFFQFIQSLQKMGKNQQILVQQEVFGEKQILKMAEFLQTDFGKQAALVGGPSSAQLTPGLESLAAKSDLKDALTARRTLNDTLEKSRAITEAMVRSQDTQAKQDLKKENLQIKSYNDLAAISIASTEILDLVKQTTLGITSLLVQMTDLSKNVKKMTDSNVMRGIIKYFGGK
jgi:uncharacterized protein YidB (DUF937 family)